MANDDEKLCYWGRKCWPRAFVLAQMKIADIVLLDIYEGFAKGKAPDMSQMQTPSTTTAPSPTSDYNDIAGAEVVVVASGFEAPGMTGKI